MANAHPHTGDASVSFLDETRVPVEVIEAPAPEAEGEKGVRPPWRTTPSAAGAAVRAMSARGRKTRAQPRGHGSDQPLLRVTGRPNPTLRGVTGTEP